MLGLYRFNKPEYFFQPSRVWRRLQNKPPAAELSSETLPWGQTIEVNPRETIGKAIYTLGVYELAQTELIWRSLPFVDAFVDAGANIGYFSLLALGNRKFSGDIYSFEPHPSIFERLSQNVYAQANGRRRASLYMAALSDRPGVAKLFVPDGFQANEGVASLERPAEGCAALDTELVSLDGAVPSNKKYIIKIDTEGHEAAVLRGASGLLKAGRVKAVFFEEFRSPADAESFAILNSFGFTISRLERSFFGPCLVPPALKRRGRSWEPTSYLALLPDGIPHATLLRRGWSSLTGV